MSEFFLRFPQLDNEISVSTNYVRSVNIMNRAILIQIYNSLASQDNKLAIFDENYHQITKNILICNLPNLPFDDKTLVNVLYKKLSTKILSELDYSTTVSKKMNEIRKIIWSMTSMSSADYSISESFDILKMIKLFDIVPAYDISSLLDSCITFLDFINDISGQMIICFMMPDIFLDENQYQLLINHAIFSEIPVLMFNAGAFDGEHENERKTLIDQQLFETNERLL